jgi:hypothetical protein
MRKTDSLQEIIGGDPSRLDPAVQSAAPGLYAGPVSGKIGILAENGDVITRCSSGLVYTISLGGKYFGDSGSGNGEETSAPDRVISIDVRFEPSLVQKPEKPQEPAPETEDEKGNEKEEDKPGDEEASDGNGEDADDGAENGEDEEKTPQEKYEERIKEYEQDLKDYNRKINEARDRARKLQKDFSQWFYIIPANTFNKLIITRDSLLKEKEEDEDEEK